MADLKGDVREWGITGWLNVSFSFRVSSGAMLHEIIIGQISKSHMPASHRTGFIGKLLLKVNRFLHIDNDVDFAHRTASIGLDIANGQLLTRLKVWRVVKINADVDLAGTAPPIQFHTADIIRHFLVNRLVINVSVNDPTIIVKPSFDAVLDLEHIPVGRVTGG